MHFSIDRTVHTTAFDKPVVDHWLELKIAQTAAGSTEKAIWDKSRTYLFRLNTFFFLSNTFSNENKVVCNHTLGDLL